MIIPPTPTLLPMIGNHKMIAIHQIQDLLMILTVVVGIGKKLMKGPQIGVSQFFFDF
jgi:hypothetical protein